MNRKLPKMRIPDAMEEYVRELLREGLSQRAVAKQAGVSRATVGSIAQGRPSRKRSRPDASESYPGWTGEGPFVRCPECGGRVIAPCLLCRIRERRQARRTAERRMAS